MLRKLVTRREHALHEYVQYRHITHLWGPTPMPRKFRHASHRARLRLAVWDTVLNIVTLNGRI